MIPALALLVPLVTGPVVARVCFAGPAEADWVAYETLDRKRAFLCVTEVPCKDAELVVHRLGRAPEGASVPTYYVSKSPRECQ